MSRLSYEDVGITEPEEGIIQFEILPEHLKLLRSLQLEWMIPTSGSPRTWGGLQTRTTRPYGCGDFFRCVREILENDALTEDEIGLLHRGAAQALQIALKTGKFRPKIFRAQKYSQDWHEYTPKKPKKELSDAVEEQVPLDLNEADPI